MICRHLPLSVHLEPHFGQIRHGDVRQRHLSRWVEPLEHWAPRYEARDSSGLQRGRPPAWGTLELQHSVGLAIAGEDEAAPAETRWMRILRAGSDDGAWGGQAPKRNDETECSEY
ncbi:hypothetical protein NDU88_006550 [Pleurodeles waltl]|uniref:Uncharacterized protein n=1 Tax=Pleurodeles waltl TaxID=8319 RepID=A0AAV7WB01_PLEWA|nr:hypothetical protein NDU88_006550 [Pleurodeles waltl]